MHVLQDVPTLRQARATRSAEAAAAAASEADGDDETDGSSANTDGAASADGVVIPTLAELFPVGSTCFILSTQYYGATVTVSFDWRSD